MSSNASEEMVYQRLMCMNTALLTDQQYEAFKVLRDGSYATHYERLQAVRKLLNPFDTLALVQQFEETPDAPRKQELDLLMREGTPIPSAQFQEALHQAGRFGHLWATSLYKWRKVLRKITPTREGLYAFGHFVDTGVVSGIVSPTFDPDGNIVHATGTGRSRYTIHPDGSCVFEIHRPQGLVLEGTLQGTSFTVTRTDQEVLLRHVYALSGLYDRNPTVADAVGQRALQLMNFSELYLEIAEHEKYLKIANEQDYPVDTSAIRGILEMLQGMIRVRETRHVLKVPLKNFLPGNVFGVL